jgi:hypothetical protein
MKDPQRSLQELLQTGGLNQTLFPPNSRYHGIETATLEAKPDRKIIYLKRRFCPPPERFELLQEHTVTQGDRLDNISSQYLGDPEQYWRICDANGVMRPEELTETVGRKVRITLSEGIPGTRND